MKRKLAALLLLAGLALSLTACGDDVNADAESSTESAVTEIADTPDCCPSEGSEEKDCCKQKSEAPVPAAEIPDCCGG